MFASTVASPWSPAVRVASGSRSLRSCAASGARVMISSRKAEALEAAAATIDGDAAVVRGQRRRPRRRGGLCGRHDRAVRPVDILVNNAATNPYMGKTIDIDRPRLDKTISVNWAGPLHVDTTRVAGVRCSEHGGVVLNIASIGGMSVETSIGAYNATKAALLHLTRTLAAELAPGVRVNAIAPGSGEDRHGPRPVGAERSGDRQGPCRCTGSASPPTSPAPRRSSAPTPRAGSPAPPRRRRRRPAPRLTAPRCPFRRDGAGARTSSRRRAQSRIQVTPTRWRCASSA